MLAISCNGYFWSMKKGPGLSFRVNLPDMAAKDQQIVEIVEIWCATTTPWIQRESITVKLKQSF